MPYSTTEQALYDWAKNSLPRWFFAQTRDEEELGAFVKIFDAALADIDAFFTQAFILTATSGPPDYLNQHARDRGTRRQNNEANTSLRHRLRNPEDAVTAPALLAAAQQIVDDEGIVGTVSLFGLRDHRAFMQGHENSGPFNIASIAAPATVDGVANVQLLTPEAGLSWTPELGRDRIVVNAADVDENNEGTFVLELFSGNGLGYVNATGVAEDPSLGTFEIHPYNDAGDAVDGRRRAYLGRGYRIGNSRSAFVLILPYGSTAATLASAREMLRQKKAGGILAITEYRQNP